MTEISSIMGVVKVNAGRLNLAIQEQRGAGQTQGHAPFAGRRHLCRKACESAVGLSPAGPEGPASQLVLNVLDLGMRYGSWRQ